MTSISLVVLLLSAVNAAHGLNLRYQSDAPKPNRVTVEFFYETLCPFCRQFMSTSLKKALEDKEFRERIDLHLYPFGNAMVKPLKDVSEGYQYWHADDMEKGYEYVIQCQHGEDECFGNTVQACALKHLDNETSSSFIVCMESKDGVSQEWASHDCAQEFNIKLDPIRDCVQGKDGNLDLAKLGEYTRNLKKPAGPIQYVPWVLLNGEHDHESELDGDEGNSGHFLQQLCAKLDDPKPSACSDVKVVTKASMLSTGTNTALSMQDQQQSQSAASFGCVLSADMVNL